MCHDGSTCLLSEWRLTKYVCNWQLTLQFSTENVSKAYWTILKHNDNHFVSRSLVWSFISKDNSPGNCYNDLQKTWSCMCCPARHTRTRTWNWYQRATKITYNIPLTTYGSPIWSYTTILKLIHSLVAKIFVMKIFCHPLKWKNDKSH